MLKRTAARAYFDGDGICAYRIDLSLRIHFSNEKFDFMSGARAKVNESKAKEKPEFVFYRKMEEHYPKGDLVRFIAINQLSGMTHPSAYSDSIYINWMDQNMQRQYLFDKDLKIMHETAARGGASFRQLFVSGNGGLPLALQMMNGKMVSIETICLINKITNGNVIKSIDSCCTDNFIYPNMRLRILKYEPFIPANIEKLKISLDKYL